MNRSTRKNICIVCPAKPGTLHGNRITALRWQRIFKDLGHRPRICSGPLPTQYDILIALHAWRSAAQIKQSHSRQPHRPIVVAITGTDLYRDGKRAQTQRSLQLADRLVVLQSQAVLDLPVDCRGKARVIYQSIRPLSVNRPRRPRMLRVVVAGHLRSVKDPLRTAFAVRTLPQTSKIMVDHYGAAMEASYAVRARTETEQNDRYRWHGAIPRGRLRRRLAGCWLLVLSSKMEGGANVLSEALANQCPVLASRIPGSIGILGHDYAGYFEVGKTAQLRDLLLRCEQDPSFYRQLVTQVTARSDLVKPQRERAAWKELLDELG